MIHSTKESRAESLLRKIRASAKEINEAVEKLEKAQLFSEDTTSDLISKTETVEHLRRMLEATVPNTDYDEGFVDGVEFGISTVSTMPTIQPQSTTGQLNDGARSTGQSTDLIDRQEAIDALHTWFRDGFDEDKWWNSTHVLAAIEGLHPVQQEHKWETCFECPLSHGCPKIKGCTNEQAIEYASQIPNDCPLSAQPEPQWIPVEKELPEPRIDVWVNSDLGQMVGYYEEMVNLWYGRDYLELIVNAWMPLPEPYKPNK